MGRFKDGVKATWTGILSFKDWLKELTAEFGLEALLFLIALGNADVLHHYLIKTGSTPTWQLAVAVYATELLVVWASLWRTIGLLISAVLFMVSIISIRSVFGHEWFGHAGFSLAIFCGSLGNYVRRGGWKELGTGIRFVANRGADIFKTQTTILTATIVDITGLTLIQIKDKFSTSITHATLLKQMHNNGIQITDKLVEDTRC